MPIANFLHVLPNPVSVYIISFLPIPLHTSLIVSRKDNILTNSLTSSSHSIKTVLSIDVCWNSDFRRLISLYISVVFRVSMCTYYRCLLFLMFSFLIESRLSHFCDVCQFCTVSVQKPNVIKDKQYPYFGRPKPPY